jgi:nicotinate-nucleotide adenylyltransferase
VRLGILGGSFDPPHVGHLLVAGDAFELLELTRLVFVPASVQPLKAGQAGAAPEHRLEMVKRMVAGDARFEVDRTEIDRAGLSYSVDTLESFAARYPDADRFFLVGADAFASFSAWREPERIVRLARLAVLRRPGTEGGGANGPAPGEGHMSEARLPPDAMVLSTRLIDVSSTEIRERVRSDRSIRGFVPESVEQYILAQRLYR